MRAVAAGSTGPGSWWSRMITSIPRSRASAISWTLLVPQSIVTSSVAPSAANASTAPALRP